MLYCNSPGFICFDCSHDDNANRDDQWVQMRGKEWAGRGMGRAFENDVFAQALDNACCIYTRAQLHIL